MGISLRKSYPLAIFIVLGLLDAVIRLQIRRPMYCGLVPGTGKVRSSYLQGFQTGCIVLPVCSERVMRVFSPG